MGALMVSGICRLTRDAEGKKTSIGTWYSTGIVAYRKNPKEGKQSDDFFEADIFVKNPPPGYERNLLKGRLIYIDTAYIRNDRYQNAEGADRTRVKLQISGFDLLGGDIMEAPKSEPIPETKASAPISKSTHPSDLPPPMAPKKAPVVEDMSNDDALQDWVEGR